MTGQVKVALFGGTGHVTRYMAQELQSAGFEVRLFSRNAVASAAVEAVQGDARRLEDVRRALSGCSAVVNGIGRLKNEGDFYALITRNVLAAMGELGIRRYVLVTSTVVRTSQDAGSLFTAAGRFVFGAVFPQMVKDKQAEYDLLADSNLDWTVLRLPLVLDSPRSRPVRMAATAPEWFVTNRGIARAIAGELLVPKYLRQAPYLANRLSSD